MGESQTKLDQEVIEFVDQLLDDWTGNEYQVAAEFCVGKEEIDAVYKGIADRETQWGKLKEDRNG